MRTEDNEPLWREVVGNTEPWKRGRLALVLFGVFTAGQQFLTAATIVAGGNIELLLPAAIFSILQWLQFYLIWIGVQWIRYLAGGLMAFGGLAQFFTGCSRSSGLYIVLGLFALGAGCYIALAPAVHFFARRQQERRSVLWAFITAGCFGIALALVFVAVLIFAVLKASWVNDCRGFAREAFDQIFVEHDGAFLAQHSTASTKDMSADEFVRLINEQLGAVENIEPAVVNVRSRLAWPALHIEGSAAWRGKFAHAPPVTIRMQISGTSGDWRIEHIRWDYR
jgi:hypothetical protein